MDNYAADPVSCIRQNVIMIGSPALGAMPTNPAPVDDTVSPFGDGGCTVYIKRFVYEEPGSDDDDAPTTGGDPQAGEEFMADADEGSGDDDWGAEKARIELLKAYACPPTAFRWTAIPRVTIVNPEAEMAGAYSLALGAGANRAYVLPWVADGITWMHLDFGCRFFFTDTMNGCTLFIGGSAQTPVIAHSNVARSSEIQARTPGQVKMVTDTLVTEPKWRVLDKSGYITASERERRVQPGYPVPVGTQVNVIGFNDGLIAGWQFWAQVYMLYRDEDGRQLVRDIEVDRLFP